MKNTVQSFGYSSTLLLALAAVVILGATGLYAASRFNNQGGPTRSNSPSPSQPSASSPRSSGGQLKLKNYIPGESTPPSYSQSNYYTQSGYSTGYNQSGYSTGYAQGAYSSYSQSTYGPTCSGQSPTDQCALAIPGACCAMGYLMTCGDDGSGELKCVNRVDTNGNPAPCRAFDDNHCRGCASSSGAGTYCFAKPVIYLYPTQITKVDVSVETTGQIVVSDPLYPQGGWKNVVAHPDGTLSYKGSSYRELFYETNVSDFKKPENGLIIKTENLKDELNIYITRLGLTRADERAEFLDYWIPRLKELNSPYILFSIIDAEEKDKTDKINISPKPETMIEFIAYFKPLSKPMPVLPLSLPQKPPERLGFTAVEWGGVIDK